MSSKYKQLAKNTMLFAVGSFASKILNFAIVPFYTYVLTVEEYGKADIFFTYSSLIVSVITIQIQQAMVRMLLAKETKDDIALSNCFLVFIIGVVLSIVSFPLYYSCFRDIWFSIFFCFAIIITSFNSIFTDYLIASKKNIAYTVKGIVVTIVLLTSNIIGLLFLKLGLEGYILATLISQGVGGLYLLVIGKIPKKIKIDNFDKEIMYAMLLYSVPLIPNSMMWWIMSSGDKLIINHYLGYDANGLYSLALKVPTIISLLYSFFAQAWTISAIEEYGSEDRKQFYDHIYKIMNALLIFAVAGIVILVKPVFRIMSEDYRLAWEFVPILSLATLFSCGTTFFAVIYGVLKKTKRIFFTTLLGTILNVVFNFIFVQIMGLQGIAIGTCLGYFIVYLIRAYEVKKEINMNLDTKRTLIALIIVAIQIIITIKTNNIGIIISGTAAVVSLMILYFNEILIVMAKIRGYLL